MKLYDFIFKQKIHGDWGLGSGDWGEGSGYWE